VYQGLGTRFAEKALIMEWDLAYSYTCRPPDPQTKETRLGPGGESRRCLFCGRSRAETTFKKDAHVIPAALDNRTLLSNEECDDCNGKFGETWDAHLVNSFAAHRAFWGMRARANEIKHKMRPHLGDQASNIVSTSASSPVQVTAIDGDLNLPRFLGQVR
jgi:hypothetical protein